MVVIGIDAHNCTHTAVIVETNGRHLASKTCASTTRDHFAPLRWASQRGPDRIWAIEDCRNMTRQLEHDLLAAGERIVRVPPKLVAYLHDAARTYGKFDQIDALAVARAALREDGLPAANLDGPVDRTVSAPLGRPVRWSNGCLRILRHVVQSPPGLPSSAQRSHGGRRRRGEILRMSIETNEITPGPDAVGNDERPPLRRGTLD